MCRRNQLPGVALIAFGTGVLLASLLGGGIVAVFLGVVSLLFGICVLRKN